MHKNIKNRRIRLFAAGGAVGAVVFLALFGPALFPSWDAFCRGGFVEKDILQHYAGWLFLRQSPVQFPLCFTERINWPSGISVAYTDSIPLFAAFFRFFSALLPDTFQYFGIFSLLCYVLQAGFAALLLGEWMPGILRPVMGSLLFACSPVMIERTLHHTALAAHFFILAALYYYVRSRHEERFCYWPLWALNALSITIHPYFLPMVFAVTLAMLAEYAVRHREWKKPLAFLLSDLAAAVGLGWCFGLLGSGGTDGSEMLYGYFSMNLNALWNPTSLSTVWSRFLPVQNQIRGNYDAFNYLGLGILLGCAAGALCLLRRPKRLLLLLKQHWCLTLVCACLTAFAVTNQVTANGAALLTLPLPNKLLALCSVFRSSGRLFWPVYYLLFLLALWALSQLFAGRRAALLLGALVCVQLAGQLAAVAAADLYLNAGITAVKFTDHTGQPVIIGAVGCADHNGAHIQPANLRGKLGTGFAAVQQSVNAGQQPLAGSGRAHAAMLSQQQGKAALRFQRTDRTADARGGVLQFFCCRGKAAALDGTYQRTVFFQFHGLPLSLRICQSKYVILSLYAKYIMPLY